MNKRLDLIFVEDSEVDAHLIQRVLKKEKLSDYYQWFKDGQEVIDFLTDRQNPLPSVILLDIKTPRVDGFQALEHVKNNPRTNHIPIVMFSSSRQEEDIKKAYELGVNSYLVKPDNLEDLKILLKQFLNYWVHFNNSKINDERQN